MAATKRSQNKCKKCGYTWYPRGKNISLKCPNCGSSEVSIVGPGCGTFILGAIAVGYFMLSGKHDSNSPQISISAKTTTEKTSNIPNISNSLSLASLANNE